MDFLTPIIQAVIAGLMLMLITRVIRMSTGEKSIQEQEETLEERQSERIDYPVRFTGRLDDPRMISRLAGKNSITSAFPQSESGAGCSDSEAFASNSFVESPSQDRVLPQT